MIVDILPLFSWYFGMVSREETNTMLQAERDTGVFLLRDSTSIRGDFVLCVKEDTRISHYIINKIQAGGMVKYRIGDHEFASLPELLQFYQTHYLDSTTLVRPVPRQQFITKYKFAGRDPDDLPFEKHDILFLIRKDEDQWWTMCNGHGQTGLVPVPYIERYNGEDQPRPVNSSTSQQQRPVVNSTQQPSYDNPPLYASLPEATVHKQRILPARAIVVKNRNPSAYDSTALTLRVGDTVLVTAMHLTGQWEGQLNGASGFFPFTHIKFIDEDDESDSSSRAT